MKCEGSEVEEFGEEKGSEEWVVASDRIRVRADTGPQTGVREIIEEHQDGAGTERNLCLLRWLSSSLAQQEK